MKTWEEIEKEQKLVCNRLNVPWTPIENELMIAFNESMIINPRPINGLRHPKGKQIDGWYLWGGGEIPQDKDDFFKPIHPEHLVEKCSFVLKYLGLPYGY